MVAAGDVPDGASLNLLWSFEVPQGGNKVAAPADAMETGVTAGNVDG